MAKYAVVQTSNGVVVNIVEWDGAANWAPPAGFTVRLAVPSDATPSDPTTAGEGSIVTNLQLAADTLRTYVALGPAPSAAQTTAAVRVMAAAVIRLIRYSLAQTDADS